MKNSICLCSLCKKPSFDHSKQDEKDALSYVRIVKILDI